MARNLVYKSYPGLPSPATIIYDPHFNDVPDPRLRHLYERWQEVGAAESGPAIVDAAETQPLLRNVMLLQIIREGFLELDYLYRIYGPDIAARYGTDMTGRRTSEFPGGVSKMFLELYERAVDSAIAIYSEHAPPPTVNVKMWERLILPLGKDPVKWLLVVNLPKGKRREV